jgi:hypothetical protein
MMVLKRSFIDYCNSVTCLVIIFQLGRVELVISLFPFNIITFNNYGDYRINSHIHFALSKTQSSGVVIESLMKKIIFLVKRIIKQQVKLLVHISLNILIK